MHKGRLAPRHLSRGMAVECDPRYTPPLQCGVGGVINYAGGLTVDLPILWRPLDQDVVNLNYTTSGIFTAGGLTFSWFFAAVVRVTDPGMIFQYTAQHAGSTLQAIAVWDQPWDWANNLHGIAWDLTTVDPPFYAPAVWDPQLFAKPYF